MDDPAAFLAEAEPLLLADEARHNLVLGIAGNVRDGLYEDFRLWLVRDGGEAAGVALQTGPYNLILARPVSPTALAALAEAVAAEELPGVVGAEPEVHEFAELWTRRTGRPARTNMRQGRLRTRTSRTAARRAGLGPRRDEGGPRACGALVDRVRRGGAP